MLLTRYWGYLAVVIAMAGSLLNSLALVVARAVSSAALGRFFFQALMWCGSETQKGQCAGRTGLGLQVGSSA
jgi:hypothetical protein